MSVNGEYQRILGNLVAFLERTPVPGSEDWIRELEATARAGRGNVSLAADRTLAFLQEKSAPSFASPLEIEEFARLQEHLASICSVVLGR
jgi:hypothetical protein